MIDLENIRKTYEPAGRAVNALVDVNLNIREGEVFGIIGRSGAGKSTLIRMLNLLERPSEGSVRVDGRDITAFSDAQLREYRRSVGMVFQHFNLLRSRTVMDNVCFPLRLSGMPREAREARAREVLNLVGLADQAHKYPGQLSGGQQQRVGIARALASKPRLLLCDEATSALDPETTQSILRLLGDINRRLGLTIVLITHGMDVIRAVCDRVAVIEGGRIVSRVFHDRSELAELAEPVIVNCIGYGARALFGDDSLVPVRGQIGWLAPQPGVTYAINYNAVSMVPRHDGVVIQANGRSEMVGYGVEDETPHRAETEAALAALSTLFRPA